MMITSFFFPSKIPWIYFSIFSFSFMADVDISLIRRGKEDLCGDSQGDGL